MTENFDWYIIRLSLRGYQYRRVDGRAIIRRVGTAESYCSYNNNNNNNNNNNTTFDPCTMELNCVTYANPKYIIIVKVWILTCAYYDNNIVPLLSTRAQCYNNILIYLRPAPPKSRVQNARGSSLLKTDGWARYRACTL